mmetsp:Transcript_66602/g.210882  ORF Transcript_66602/g.210882 Transcript_66602/m.210882 type:complete len:262 (+) Transcript_66602:319-1104(+)
MRSAPTTPPPSALPLSTTSCSIPSRSRGSAWEAHGTSSCPSPRGLSGTAAQAPRSATPRCRGTGAWWRPPWPSSRTCASSTAGCSSSGMPGRSLRGGCSSTWKVPPSRRSCPPTRTPSGSTRCPTARRSERASTATGSRGPRARSARPPPPKGLLRWPTRCGRSSKAVSRQFRCSSNRTTWRSPSTWTCTAGTRSGARRRPSQSMSSSARTSSSSPRRCASCRCACSRPWTTRSLRCTPLPMPPPAAALTAAAAAAPRGSR